MIGVKISLKEIAVPYQISTLTLHQKRTIVDALQNELWENYYYKTWCQKKCSGTSKETNCIGRTKDSYRKKRTLKLVRHTL